MLKNSIKMQWNVLWERRTATIMLALVTALMLVNFFSNVWIYQGRDVLDMYHPMKLLTLSSWSQYSYYLMQYYPLLVVIPAGFALFADKQLNHYIFIQTRVGAKAYYWGKLVVVFLVTFLVFAGPFLLEIILNIIAFPINAVGDPANFGVYDANYLDQIDMQLFSSLYAKSQYAYALVFTLIFGLISGVLAIFTVAVSMFQIRYRIFLFLPCYLLLHLLAYVNQLIPVITLETNYFFYLVFYNHFRNATGSSIALVVITLSICLVSILIFSIKMRKDAF